MNDTLKVAGRIGAELGAAKAENEMLREALSRIANLPMHQCSTENDYRLSAAKVMAFDALTHQADPTENTEAYTARDMATAAAQGFRDGQAAVEQAVAQDEREAPEVVAIPCCSKDGDWYIDALHPSRLGEHGYLAEGDELMTVAQHERIVAALSARPAQTEQQPVAWLQECWSDTELSHYPLSDEELRSGYWKETPLYVAPIAQTAPQGKFRMGDLVKKSTGSEWEGRVVGWYSTEQTKEGYAVESEVHKGSVQIYPAKALELVPMAAKEPEPEHVCSGCGAKGWTGNCLECIPY